ARPGGGGLALGPAAVFGDAGAGGRCRLAGRRAEFPPRHWRGRTRGRRRPRTGCAAGSLIPRGRHARSANQERAVAPGGGGGSPTVAGLAPVRAATASTITSGAQPRTR